MKHTVQINTFLVSIEEAIFFTSERKLSLLDILRISTLICFHILGAADIKARFSISVRTPIVVRSPLD
jgi:hypothetical protein